MSWNIAKPGDQINGPANITGNLTVDTNTLFVDSVNNRVGVLTTSPTVPLDVVGNARVSGTLSVQGRDIKSAIRAAASDYAGICGAGNIGSSAYIATTLTGQALGTGDFSVWARFKVPASVNSGDAPVVFSITDGASNYMGMMLNSINDWMVNKTISGVAANAVVTGFTASAYVGQVVDVVLVSQSGVMTAYLNGTQLTLSNTSSGFNWTSSAAFRVGGYFVASQNFTQPIYRSVLFNRALSEADVVDLIETGVNPADQWGTQTQLINASTLNGGFETNSLNASGTWAASVLGTSTATIDTSGAFSRTGTNAGKLTLDSSGSFASFFANNLANIITFGKRYRLSVWARKGATSGSCGIQYGGSTVWVNSGLVLTTSYQNFVFEGIPPTAAGQNLNIARQSGSAGNSEIYIDDVELTRIGAIVDLDFTVGAGYQATDRSNNALHGTLFNGVSFTDPKMAAIIYATTSTSGNQQMLGSLAIPTNAIIEDIIVNSTGTATVSIGNASAGTQIVNAASVVAGRQKLTIATPFSTTGNLWVNSSSTATLQFTILYTIAA